MRVNSEAGKRWGVVAALVMACAVVFFWRLGGNGLFDLDEALYANAARSMAVTGDLVTPRVNGVPFFEKPPLIYWEAALFMRLLGQNELAVRLPSALASTVVVLLLFAFGRRLFDTRVGLFAALFYALSPLAFGAARQLTTDATLNACVLATLLCFFLGHEDPTPAGRRWFYGFWAASALSVLAKGAVGLLFPLLIAFIYVGMVDGWTGRAIGPVVRRACPLPALLLFLAIALPWHVAVYHASGDAFVREYVVRQHLQRFQGGDTSHRAPFWFYVPGFLLGFFPWSVLTPAALFERGTADRGATRGRARLFLRVWAAVVFVFFSLSGSKLISYILPMYPAAALLVAEWSSRAIATGWRDRVLRAGAWGAAVLSCVLAMILLARAPIIASVAAHSRKPLVIDAGTYAVLAMAAHLLTAAAVACLLWLCLLYARRRTEAFAAALVGMGVFFAIAVGEGLATVDAAFCRPLQRMARDAAPLLTDGSPIYTAIGSPSRPSVLFYLPGDRVSGRRSSPTALVPDMPEEEQLRDVLAHSRRAVVLGDTRKLPTLLADPRIRLLSRQDRWVLARWEQP